MTIAILNRLTEEVLARMPEVARTNARLGSLSVWARPPLLSGLTLGSVSLDDVDTLKSKFGSYELADLYEEFIEGYYLTNDLHYKRPARWIRENLGLSAIEGKRIAPTKLNTGRPACNEDWLAIVLWVIHKSVADSELTVNATSMVVSFEDMRVGVLNGKLLSAHYPDTPLAIVPDFKALLTQSVLGTRGACRHASLNRYYLIAGQQPEGPALQLALRALYWRVADPDRLESRLFGVERKHRGQDLIEEIKQGLLVEPDPLKFLSQHLVPRYTNAADFRQCFGNPSRKMAKVMPRTLEKWLLTIESQILQVDGE